MSSEKLFVSADSLLDDAFRLGQRIAASGYRPDILIALWRGGTPVGIAVQELLTYLGIETRHFAVKTSHYSGIDARKDDILIEGLEAPLAAMAPDSNVLIVDDVFDTGLTLERLAGMLEQTIRSGEIRTATPYFKPACNKTTRRPDYYLHETDRWIVFPHELTGLSAEEILAGKKGLGVLREILRTTPSTSPD